MSDLADTIKVWHVSGGLVDDPLQGRQQQGFFEGTAQHSAEAAAWRNSFRTDAPNLLFT